MKLINNRTTPPPLSEHNQYRCAQNHHYLNSTQNFLTQPQIPYKRSFQYFFIKTPRGICSPSLQWVDKSNIVQLEICSPRVLTEWH